MCRIIQPSFSKDNKMAQFRLFGFIIRAQASLYPPFPLSGRLGVVPFQKSSACLAQKRKKISAIRD